MVLLLAVINSLCLKRVNPRHNVKITKLNACLVSTEHHLLFFHMKEVPDYPYADARVTRQICENLSMFDVHIKR